MPAPAAVFLDIPPDRPGVAARVLSLGARKWLGKDGAWSAGRFDPAKHSLASARVEEHETLVEVALPPLPPGAYRVEAFDPKAKAGAQILQAAVLDVPEAAEAPQVFVNVGPATVTYGPRA